MVYCRSDNYAAAALRNRFALDIGQFGHIINCFVQYCVTLQFQLVH